MKSNQARYNRLINNEISNKIGTYLMLVVFLAGIMVFVNLYIYANISTKEVLFSTAITLVAAILVKWIMSLDINDTIKQITVTFIVAGIYTYVITIRPEMVGISGWAGIFVFIAISVLYINRFFSLLLAGAAIGITVFYSNNYPIVEVDITMGTYLTRLSIMIAATLTAWYSNKEFERRIITNSEKILEISQLNERIMASKEALTSKNIAIETATAKVYKMAYYNRLTNLPMRTKLFDDYKDMADELKNSRESKKAVFSISINNFNMLQNIHGQEIRDQYLVEIVNALLEIVSNSRGQLYHIDDDEFVFILDYYLKDQYIINLSEQMCKIFNNPIFSHIQDYYLAIYVGIAVFPRHGVDLPSLLQKANSTLNYLKETSSNSIMVYGDFIKDAWEREVGIKEALDNPLDDMFLCLQPVVNYKERTIKGFEALLRWDSPEFGMVSPAEFIPYSEENMSIIPIGYWVIEKALFLIRKINEELSKSLVISINISVVQLLNSHFFDIFETLVLSSGVDVNLIELELTENVLIDSFSDVLDILTRLKRLGVSIALDDFGTGYSSLSYLHRLPIDVLKIDQTFIKDMENGDENALVKTMIKMAHQLNQTVVAEGIETKEQLKILNEFDCNYIQGYLFSKPIAARDYDDFMLAYNRFLKELELFEE